MCKDRGEWSLRTSGGCIDRRRRPIAMPINGKPTTITTITAMLVAVRPEDPECVLGWAAAAPCRSIHLIGSAGLVMAHPCLQRLAAVLWIVTRK